MPAMQMIYLLIKNLQFRDIAFVSKYMQNSFKGVNFIIIQVNLIMDFILDAV